MPERFNYETRQWDTYTINNAEECLAEIASSLPDGYDDFRISVVCSAVTEAIKAGFQFSEYLLGHIDEIAEWTEGSYEGLAEGK